MFALNREIRNGRGREVKQVREGMIKKERERVRVQLRTTYIQKDREKGKKRGGEGCTVPIDCSAV